MAFFPKHDDATPEVCKNLCPVFNVCQMENDGEHRRELKKLDGNEPAQQRHVLEVITGALSKLFSFPSSNVTPIRSHPGFDPRLN